VAGHGNVIPLSRKLPDFDALVGAAACNELIVLAEGTGLDRRLKIVILILLACVHLPDLDIPILISRRNELASRIESHAQPTTFPGRDPMLRSSRQLLVILNHGLPQVHHRLHLHRVRLFIVTRHCIDMLRLNLTVQLVHFIHLVY
jgi:hypothetical protein